jgi:hypothetical protein
MYYLHERQRGKCSSGAYCYKVIRGMSISQWCCSSIPAQSMGRDSRCLSLRQHKYRPANPHKSSEKKKPCNFYSNAPDRKRGVDLDSFIACNWGYGSGQCSVGRGSGCQLTVMTLHETTRRWNPTSSMEH